MHNTYVNLLTFLLDAVDDSKRLLRAMSALCMKYARISGRDVGHVIYIGAHACSCVDWKTCARAQ